MFILVYKVVMGFEEEITHHEHAPSLLRLPLTLYKISICQVSPLSRYGLPPFSQSVLLGRKSLS
jgi:hypothetical protein